MYDIELVKEILQMRSPNSANVGRSVFTLPK